MPREGHHGLDPRVSSAAVDELTREEPAAAPRALSRRTVLAAAVAGGAGVAATRLLPAAGTPSRGPIPVTGGLANAQGLDWVSPLDGDRARVAQLLRRTTFGYTLAEFESAAADGFTRTVDRLLETKPADPPAFQAGDAASQGVPLKVSELQVWWLDWMLASPTPFAERLTLFWHGHFTSDFRKVGNQFPYLYWQNLTWRSFARSDLRSMLFEVTVDPAMLRYLDLGNSTGRNPNENYARELMEVFTMGAEHFTEDDVRNASKALAGWREPRTEAMVKAQIEQAVKRTGSAPANPPKADTTKVGVFEPNRAYVGALPFLGVTRQWDTKGVIDRILEQDATAPFIARKLAVELVSPEPSDGYVGRLAETFRETKYSLKDLLRAVLVSPEFVAPTAYRALIKSPVEFMVSAARALANPGLTKAMPAAGLAMGQSLFDPPSVGGWPSNESWVSSSAMLARANFVTAAVQQTRKLPPAADAHATILDAVLSPQTIALLNNASDERQRWTLLLAAPEFQLK